MENFMNFSPQQEQEFIGWLLGWACLAALFVWVVRSTEARIGCLAQVGLFTIFLLIGALTSFYFYLVLPLYLLTQAVVAYTKRRKPS